MTTYAYQSMKNGILEHLRPHPLNVVSIDNIDDLPDDHDFECDFLFKDSLETLSQDAKYICSLVFENPEEYTSLPPKKARGKIKNQLRDNGWSWGRIWDSYKELKKFIAEA